jgi:hypothetical protein
VNRTAAQPFPLSDIVVKGGYSGKFYYSILSLRGCVVRFSLRRVDLERTTNTRARMPFRIRCVMRKIQLYSNPRIVCEYMVRPDSEFYFYLVVG